MYYYFTQAMVFAGLVFASCNVIKTGTKTIVKASGGSPSIEILKRQNGILKRTKESKEILKKNTNSVINERIFAVIGFLFSAFGILLQSIFVTVSCDIVEQRIGFAVYSILFLAIGFVVKYIMNLIVRKRVYRDIDNDQVDTLNGQLVFVEDEK